MANHVKTEFLANMSHELRTPLNAIIGFTQVLEMKLASQLDDKQQSHLNNIKDAGYHRLAIVNDIRDLAKMESSKTEVDVNPFNFGKMLERSPSIIRPVALQKGIKIQCDIESNLGWLKGDETRLKQVIYNLFSNATKFTESGKKIGIEAKAEDDEFVIIVWGEGVGIPEDYIEMIFDLFEQVNFNSRSSEKGTGLDLAISKKLIEHHGGALTETSTVGEGSRFTIRLPGRTVGSEDKEKEKAVLDEIPAAVAAGPRSILVTDDNRMNRELIQSTLQHYNLDFAESGEESVKKASENNYDMVLMDIHLPGIDGIEAMRRIRSNLRNSIPIVAITAFAMKGDCDYYIEQGFNEYISKPIDVTQLRNYVDRALSEKPIGHPADQMPAAQ